MNCKREEILQQFLKEKARATFNPSTEEAEAGGSLSSRTARAAHRNPVLKKKRKRKGKSCFKNKYINWYVWLID